MASGNYGAGRIGGNDILLALVVLPGRQHQPIACGVLIGVPRAVHFRFFGDHNGHIQVGFICG